MTKEDMTIAYLMGKYEDKEPCEDAISREDVLKLIYDFKEKHTEDREKHPINYGTLLDLIRLIRELPPVTPSRRKGHWIYDETIENWRCSKCNETPKTMGYVGAADFMAEHFKFCNHCGAEMG